MIDRKRVILYIMSCVQQEHKTIRNARVAQLVERDLAKVEAAGSSPVSRFFHALKSVEIRFQGIFFVPEKIVCRILMATMQNCYFSRKGVCDKIEKMTAQEQLSLGEKR